MGRISNAYHGLKGIYYRWRGKTPKPQTVDLGRRDATRRILGTVGVVVGAAAGATSLGALLSACKEKSETVKTKGIEIVSSSIAEAAKRTRPYGFYIEKWGGEKCVRERDKKVLERWDYASVAVDVNRVRRIEFMDADSAYITIDGQYTKKGSVLQMEKKISYGPSFLLPFSFSCPSNALISGSEMVMKDGVPYTSVGGYLPGETFSRDMAKINLQIEYKDGSTMNYSLKIQK